MNDPSKLVTRFFTDIEEASAIGPVLDLACGNGRNGLYLVDEGISVTFADRNESSLMDIEMTLVMNAVLEKNNVWDVDLEAADFEGLPENHFGAVMVFRYLHRPLFNSIKNAIKPGGLIIYETFTLMQANFGRPTNPNFLLHPNELNRVFGDWEILHSYEGITTREGDNAKQATAQIVARKPE